MHRALILAILTLLPLTGQAATCWEIVNARITLCDSVGACGPYVTNLAIPSSAPVDQCDVAPFQNPTGTGVGHVVLLDSSDWSAAANAQLDWNIVRESFGWGMLLFVTGAGTGLIINIVRRGR
ncbi:hypothetical protein MoryE10_34010 [Methylogaea oryzae]|uniref:Uncharacterized protein n=1 Tax=Methylogaea oryzae TaxID=1295382 RepID=A0A8D5AP81_9GAMM|nr:hypothetical protein MoryE10_34010 [Methylogaea oryzae]